MSIWIQWWNIVKQLRPCFARQATFLWFALVLAGFSTRADLAGITSIIRSLGLDKFYYDRVLDFFHSSAVRLTLLSQKWFQIVLATGLAYKVNGRVVILGDGVKAPKEGHKMPGVKSLHQESGSNSKPEYIMGHSCQAISLLTRAFTHFFATPLICQVHEGVVESNRDKRTLLDKMVIMIASLNISVPFYFVADAYYASKKIIEPLIKKGIHLICRVRMNAVAYEPLPASNKKAKRGRPKLYGKKIKLRDVFKQTEKMTPATVLIYGKEVNLSYRTLDLVWRPIGIIVRFVFVLYPEGAMAIFLSTDLLLHPLEIINLYSLRYKIEVLFKQAIRTIGALSYHFWMKTMEKISRKSGNQYLHKKSPLYRKQVQRKLRAYHLYIQTALIAQGIMQIISMTVPQLVWDSFGSWIRTIRPNTLPSEHVVMTALRNNLPDFLADTNSDPILAKFILEKIDSNRYEGKRMFFYANSA